MAELWPDKLRGARIGPLLHAASISSKLEHSSRILERHHGQLFRLAAFFGPQLHVVDRNSFRPFQTAVEIIKRIRAIYGEEFQWKQPPYEYERKTSD